MKKQNINHEVLAQNVILIDEEGNSLGNLSYDQAMLLGYDKGLDLVEVGPNSKPPICKLMDYGKELYREQKQIRKHKAKQKNPEVKEIKLSIRIDEHDFSTKVNRAKEFFDEGDKVRVFIKLMGREMMFKNKAEESINKFMTETNADFEQATKRLGNQIFAIIKKKK